jgi:hypothetical protein
LTERRSSIHTSHETQLTTSHHIPSQPFCQQQGPDDPDDSSTTTYSSAPRDPATDPLWQDHWKPCAWPLPRPVAVAAGQQWTVQGAHDDGGVWIAAQPQQQQEEEQVVDLREGPVPCACGLHGKGDGQEAGGVPGWRIRELNDAGRYVCVIRFMVMWWAVLRSSRPDRHMSGQARID